MVGPIFEKFLSKDAQNSKEKSQKMSVQDFLALKNYREKCRGGGFSSPPPGLNRVKHYIEPTAMKLTRAIKT